MQTVRVAAAYFPVGPGVRLRLDAGQAAARGHALRPLGDGLYEVTQRTGFKLGECFGYDGPMDKARLADVVDAETGAAFSIEDFRAAAVETGDGAALEALSDAELAAVAGAIAALDPEDAAHFTRDGKPDAKVLGELTGFKVSAKLRDAAWAAFLAVRGALAAGEDGVGAAAGGGGDLGV